MASAHHELLASTPMEPLLHRAAENFRRASDAWVISAFVTRSAVEQLLGPAVTRGVRVHLLTGTFGNFNRREMFAGTLALSKGHSNFQARVWSGDESRRLHAKLYLWRFGEEGEAWIGSANFTDGGLRNDGELVSVHKGSWTSLSAFRDRVALEWQRSEELTAAFVDSYQESKLAPPDEGATPPKPSLPQDGRILVASISYHIDPESEVAERVDAVAPEDVADLEDDIAWYRTTARMPRTARPGEWVCLVDVEDDCVRVGRVLGGGPQGGSWVLWYRQELDDIPWDDRAKAVLAAAGTSTNPSGTPRMKWIDPPAMLRATLADLLVEDV